MYITRDGGKNWTKITPPGMPDFGRVSLIDASPHNPGGAYVAVKNYQNDDRKPYIFKTADYGKTWTKIVNGIPDNDFVHAVREDPVKPGLLFAGTEHGIYVSFDDGGAVAVDPPESARYPGVSDLLIEGNDLVIATHGRSFYVMDDITPLRQLHAGDGDRDRAPVCATRGGADSQPGAHRLLSVEARGQDPDRYSGFQGTGGPHLHRHAERPAGWARWTGGPRRGCRRCGVH